MADAPPDLHELEHLQCESCGGTFGLLERLDVVVCPCCTLAQVIPDSRVERALGYIQAAAEQAAALNHEVEARRRADNLDRSTSFGMGVLGLFVAIAAFIVMAFWMASVTTGWTMLGVARNLSLTVAWGALLWLYLVLPSVRGRQATKNLGMVYAGCSSCGATLKIAIGSPLGVCVQCGSSQMKTDAVVAVGLSVGAARVQFGEKVRRLGLWQSRRGRKGGFLNLPDGFGTFWYHLTIWSVILIVLFVDSHWKFLFVFLALTSAPIFLGLVAARRWWRMRRLPAFVALPKHIPGARLVSNVDEIIPWVATYWDHDWTPHRIEHGFCAALMHYHGFPVLLIGADNSKGSTLEVLVACADSHATDGRRWSLSDREFKRYMSHPGLLVELVHHGVMRIQESGKRPAPRI